MNQNVPEIDPFLDLPKLILSTDEFIKIAQKHNKSLKGDNYYGRKFVEIHANVTNSIERIKERLSTVENNEDANLALKEISDNLNIYFNPVTDAVERSTISKTILFTFNTRIKSSLVNSKSHAPSDALFPLELVSNTRDYIEKIAKQACGCYDLGWYDASAVMMRRLLETLIIECFEAHGIAIKIKDQGGNFFFLEGLISKYLEEDGQKWSVGRNVRKGIPMLKKIGDQSAHSRTFIARKPDIEQLKEKGEIRLVIEELVSHSKLKK